MINLDKLVLASTDAENVWLKSEKYSGSIGSLPTNERLSPAVC